MAVFLILFLFVALLVGIVCSLRWLLRRLGPVWSALLMAVLCLLWTFSAGTHDQHDRRSFLPFTGMALPEDAADFSWDRRNADYFGDHDGIVFFRASEASLRRLTDSPFKGRSAWTPAGDGKSWTMSYFQDGGISAEGKIDLSSGTFRIEYSTW